ncbi:hypothetical protein [Mycobacterium sp.]|uniref:hypothetical protein n=1 Tax=Mycobacterium sp. TaxID=1785 RepID=UPI003D14F05D
MAADASRGIEVLRAQCRLFMIGSSLFAIGTAPGLAAFWSAQGSNLLCFMGSWFFTSAALLQLLLSKPAMRRTWSVPSTRAECLSSAIQLFGTLNFNLSTGAALWAQRVPARRHLVWGPDAVGSMAFLVSGVLGVAAVALAIGLQRWKSRPWLAASTSMIGSIAFAASAVGAFVTNAGSTEDAQLARLGTFVGALCFLTAAYLRLPRRCADSARTA